MNKEVIEALTHPIPLLLPEMVLGVAACVLFVGATFRPNRHLWGAVALATLVLAGVALFATGQPLPQPTPEESAQAAAKAWPGHAPQWPRDQAEARTYSGPIFVDSLAMLVKIIALVGGAVLLLFNWNDVPDRWAAEYNACLLLIVAGLCLTASANELVTLFLALELISIPTYVMLYLARSDQASQEAAMKYFLLSIFSSALLLFGFSYLYGLGGTTNLPALLEALSRRDEVTTRAAEPARLPAVVLIALVMVVAGLGFKITAVPFHFYAPDVYQGTSTGNAALLAFIPKAAGFVALLRVLGFVWAGQAGTGLTLGDQVPSLLWILAAVTMTLGNVLALLQNNVKRLLAYSSVAHAGYMLIGLTVAAHKGSIPSLGVKGLLFYLVAYGSMTVGAFAVLGYLGTSRRPVETEDDLSGLGTSHPGIALLMAIFLFSLIGIPFTAGFNGKLLLFLGAMSVEEKLYRALAIIGAVNAAIGGWYYLRIVARMYLHTPVKPLEKTVAWPGLAALWICAALTLGFGIYPAPLVEAAGKAAAMAHPAPSSGMNAKR